MSDMKKILIVGFEKYNDKMYPHTKYFIDFVLKNMSVDYFIFRERLFIFQSATKFLWPFNVKKFLKFIRAFFYIFFDFIKLKKKLSRKKYDHIIAIDICAYCAAALADKNNVTIFWSHDILNQYNLYDNIIYKWVSKLCAGLIKKNRRVIIQDNERLKLFCENIDVNLTDCDTFFLPVSLKNLKPADAAIKNLNLPTILQCGAICKSRLSDIILSDYQKNHDLYKLSFHGFIDSEMIRAIKSAAKQPLISTKIVSSEMIYQIIEHCEIGFVGYLQKDLNTYYIKNACGQALEFLKAGVPIIVMGNTNLKELVKDEKIGVAIDNQSEIKDAVKYIKQNYKTLSENCMLCFQKYYNIDNYSAGFISWLNKDYKLIK